MRVLGNCWEIVKGVLRAARPRSPFQGEYPPGLPWQSRPVTLALFKMSTRRDFHGKVVWLDTLIVYLLVWILAYS